MSSGKKRQRTIEVDPLEDDEEESEAQTDTHTGVTAAAAQLEPGSAKYVIKKDCRVPGQPADYLKQLLKTPLAGGHAVEPVEDSFSDEDAYQPTAMQEPKIFHSSVALPGSSAAVQQNGSTAKTPSNPVAALIGSSLLRGAAVRDAPTPQTGTGREITAVTEISTPLLVQRQFLASHFKMASSSAKPSSARRPTPKKGIGRLANQLQHVIKDTVKIETSTTEHLTLEILEKSIDGQFLQGWCRVDAAKSNCSRTFPEALLVIFKTFPRLDVSVGSMVIIKPVWQTIALPDQTVLLVSDASSM